MMYALCKIHRNVYLLLSMGPGVRSETVCENNYYVSGKRNTLNIELTYMLNF